MCFEVSSIFFHATPGKVTCSIIRPTSLAHNPWITHALETSLATKISCLVVLYSHEIALYSSKDLKLFFPTHKYTEMEGILELKCPCSSCVLQCQAEQFQIHGSKYAMHNLPPKKRLAQILSKLSGTSLRTKRRKALEKLWFIFLFIYSWNRLDFNESLIFTTML